SIGELWALPTMLRLVLIENLRRLAERMVWGWEERGRAERWADEVLAHAHPFAHAPERVAPGDAVRPALPSFEGLSDPFVVRLMQLLRDQEGATAAFEHLEAELAARGSDSNE